MNLLPVLHQKQQRQSDCLVACAAMVLCYLQIPFRYERLAKLLETEQHGTVFRKLQNLRALYVSVQIQEGDFQAVDDALAIGLPVIVAINTGELKSYWQSAVAHAVVVIGMDKEFIYLDDPALEDAPQRVTIAEFDLAWLEQENLLCIVSL
jgi:ABC-type bacteriocin/lantibiotic exporter with double-glycine peptidase domain